MEKTVYSSRAWRELPRDGDCVAEFLFGEAVGPCHGSIHRHHVRPGDPRSRSYQACATHHPMIEAFLRRVMRPRWRRCPHVHLYAGAKEACERRLNRDALAEAGSRA